MRLLWQRPARFERLTISPPTPLAESLKPGKLKIPAGLLWPLLGFIWLKTWTTLTPVCLILFSGLKPHTAYPTQPQMLQALQENLFGRFLLAPWYRFDTVHYLEIAAGGYSNSTLAAWAPLYPLTISLLSGLGIQPMAAALLISNLACLGFLILFYRLGCRFLDAGKARSALLGLIFFPTSFFLLAGYTESLFLVFALLFFIFLFDKKWFWAGLVGAAASLTRFQGAALALPAVWMVWQIGRAAPKNKKWRFFARADTPLWAPALPVLALAGWLAWLYWGLHLPLPWEVLSSYWGQHSGFPWEGIIGNLTSLLGLRTIPNNPISLVAQFYDLSLIILSILLIVKSIRNFQDMPFALHLYLWVSLLTILIKVDDRWLLISASRYLLTAFPLFYLFGQNVTRQWAQLSWLAAGFLSQLLLLICFYFWTWVG